MLLNPILIDAGPFIALFNKRDKYHAAIKAFLKVSRYRFISTLAVFTEVSHVLNLHQGAQRDFYEWVIYRGVIISDINQHDMPRLLELTGKYADLPGNRPVPLDFADATLVITAEKTGIREIISFDKDFDIYRLPGREEIHNIFRF